MNTTQFVNRHISLNENDTREMLDKVGVPDIQELVNQTIPSTIRLEKDIEISQPLSEYEMLLHSKELASKNALYDTYIGFGYYGTILPSAIQRNILENAGWYTAYTPYQAEIAQGRLEALLNYQTAISDLTGFSLANASLLDEGTAAAEAMHMFFASRTKDQKKNNANKFFVSELVYPQTIAVLKTKAEGLGIEVIIGKHDDHHFDETFFGALLQYPGKNGAVIDYTETISQLKGIELQVVVACDILSLVKLKSPATMGADCAVGTTQRFGIPMGYGGPHAAYFACKESYKRDIPGRIIGISQDAYGGKALRMALQTREQHIKREKATSNICTSQVLLAVMAGMYVVYHGPKGLKFIVDDIHYKANALSSALKNLGYNVIDETTFDVVKFRLSEEEKSKLKVVLEENKINLNLFIDSVVAISLDETSTLNKVQKLVDVLAQFANKPSMKLEVKEETTIPADLLRTDDILTNEIFNKYHTETELMRYIKKLERKDLSLVHSMISLGSCTMKLNAATEMLPISWAEWGNIHPFVPVEQAGGYHQLISELEKNLAEITGFAGTSLQPNSGAQGEYAGLMVIREYHKSQGNAHRNIVLIPQSAHGTNPASAIMAGMKVVVVKNLENGEIDFEDLKAKAEQHKDNLSAVMITYPSTYGFFDSNVKQSIDAISSAPFGSALVQNITYAYIKMMGAEGLKKATAHAILNANYLKEVLAEHFQILYSNENGRVAHECIVDFRPFKQYGIEVGDVAKRLMDYGFHAPTVSFPVAGTLMIEPTESESKAEIDRFAEALINIKKEIEEIANGQADKENNVLKNAPHTEQIVTSDEWNKPYSREKAAYPLPWVRENKFFASVSRVDDAYGDRNLICTCNPIEAYM